MSEGLYAWAAGFLDGEGHFTLQPAGRQLQTFAPKITAAQTGREPLDKLCGLGGSVATRRRKTVAGRTVYVWCWLSAAQMRTSLPHLIPHLTVRREQAEILLEYVRRMRVRGEPGFNARLTSDEILWRQQQARALIEMRAPKG